MHIVAVVGLEVIGLQRHALYAKTVILRNKFLRRRWILHAPANTVSDVAGKLGVGRLVGKNLAKVAQPDAEAGLVIELVPQRDPLLWADLVEAAPVRLMLEAAGRAGAGGKNLVIARANVGHVSFGDRTVVERRAPVRTTLKHGQLTDLVRDLADHLDRGGAGADDADPLAGELDRLVRPIKSMERAPLERLHAFQPRQRWYRQQPDRENDEPAGQLKAVVEPEPPQMAGLVEGRRVHLTIEPHVFAQVEFVGDVVEVAQILRLRRKPFLPVPLVEQLFRKGVA